MNLHTVLVPVRKLLVASAVTMVAATCLGSAATTTSAAGQDRSDTVSATKEYKAAPTSAPAKTSKTKEW